MSDPTNSVLPSKDSSTPKFSDYHQISGFPATYYSKIDPKTLTSLKNDRIGDCAVAAAGHVIQRWMYKPPTDNDILVAYENITHKESPPGYNRFKATGDTGCSALAMMKYWQEVGIGPSKISKFYRAFTKDEIKKAIYVYEGVCAGFYVLADTRRKLIWDFTGAKLAIGGHEVALVGYDKAGFEAISDGKFVTIHNEYFDHFFIDCYVPNPG